jgi:hypothetical protein
MQLPNEKRTERQTMIDKHYKETPNGTKNTVMNMASMGV